MHTHMNSSHLWTRASLLRLGFLCIWSRFCILCILRLHQMHSMRYVAYCNWRSCSMSVCPSVVWLHCAKMAEQIELLFGLHGKTDFQNDQSAWFIYFLSLWVWSVGQSSLLPYMSVFTVWCRQYSLMAENTVTCLYSLSGADSTVWWRRIQLHVWWV